MRFTVLKTAVSGAAILAAALLVAAGARPVAAAPAPASSAKAPPATKVSAAEVPPFARIYLALRGCTSCSQCRANIRQMVRSQSERGDARLGADQVEVRYAEPRAIPLSGVIRSLAQNRLHDLSLVDVLFEARGSVTTARDGSTRFVLASTGQAFPLVADRATRPADGKPVRLLALVEGWRESGGLTLTAREFKPEG